MSLTMRERTFRSELLARTLTDGHPRCILDLGTGTGSVAIALGRSEPAIEVTGLDPDPAALDRARGKAPASSTINWVQGSSSELPFADHSFQAVTCSLVLHHLETEQKRTALAEILRVLAPGGRLQIADWGAASDPLMWFMFLSIRLLDGFARTRIHAAGALPEMIAAAGFTEVEVYRRLRTCWGSLELTTARAPGSHAVRRPSAAAAVSL